MKANSLNENFKLVTDDFDNNITNVIVSDLLSLVMRDGDEDFVFVTVQNNINSVAVSKLVGITVIILCARMKATADMIESANAHNIMIYETALSAYETAIYLSEVL